MPVFFFDSSALAKRYMPEIGTNWIRQLTSSNAGNDIVIAQITPAEIYSAMARQYHDAQIDLTRLQAFRRLFMRHVLNQYLVLNMSAVTITHSLRLLETYRLRAYDSVQLASALELNRRLTSSGQSMTFVAADVRLLQAANAEGLSTDNPNNHP